jgi:hypothetical protein
MNFVVRKFFEAIGTFYFIMCASRAAAVIRHILKTSVLREKIRIVGRAKRVRPRICSRMAPKGGINKHQHNSEY